LRVFDLESVRRSARHIGHVPSFRNDPFHAEFARLREQRGAVALEVFAELNASNAGDQCFAE
jgi:hypothetical protein